MRKDVTGYLYGGDVSRKNKLLDKQKKGKKKLLERGKGKVNIPEEVFMKMVQSSVSEAKQGSTLNQIPKVEPCFAILSACARNSGEKVPWL